MDRYCAALRLICGHLTHQQFVRQVMSVGWMCTDMAGLHVTRLDDLRPEFQEEFKPVVFRSPSGL